MNESQAPPIISEKMNANNQHTQALFFLFLCAKMQKTFYLQPKSHHLQTLKQLMPTENKNSFHFFSTFKIAKKASCGNSTLPTRFIRFLPAFCFFNNFCFRLISPP